MSNAIDNNNKQLPSEEEIRLFLKLGRRLNNFENIWLDSDRKFHYISIQAVETLAFFVEWLYLRENTTERDRFAAEMDTMSDETLRDYIRDKAVDYNEILAEKENNNYARALVQSNRNCIQEIMNEKSSKGVVESYFYWPLLSAHLSKEWMRQNMRATTDYNDLAHLKFEKIVGTKKIVYFHGFGSSCLSSTVKTLRELLPEFTVIAEDIRINPNYALPKLKDLCEKERPELVVGTSMGGMYAQQMRGFKRICINPAFDLSQHKDILHEGTFEFLNPRRNGETTFDIGPEIISHFEEMEAHQFDGITDEDRENVYGLFADNDTTVNCEDIFRQHYQNVIHFHGEHRLNRQVIEEVLVPLIKEITSK